MVLQPMMIIMSAANFNMSPLKCALILPNATLTNNMVGSVPAPKVSINKPPSRMVVADVALMAMAKVRGHGIKPFNKPAMVAPSSGPLVLDSA